jgi:hypothetical protein
MRFLLKKSYTQINDNGKKKAKFQIIEGHNTHIHQVDGLSQNGRTFHIKERVTRIKNPTENDDVRRLKEKLHNYEPSKKTSSKDKPKKVYKLKSADIHNLLRDAPKIKKPVSKKVKLNPVEVKKEVKKEVKSKPMKQKIEIEVKKKPAKK